MRAQAQNVHDRTFAQPDGEDDGRNSELQGGGQSGMCLGRQAWHCRDQDQVRTHNAPT